MLNFPSPFIRLYHSRRTLLCALAVTLSFTSPDQSVSAQQITLASGLARLSGTDLSSGIEYVRIFLDGKLITDGPSQRGTPVPSPPQLTAQCTRKPCGKLTFELFANFGGIDDTAFYPPWRPASQDDLFPPRLEKSKITLEFLGYTHVKPVKREFEAMLQPAGQLLALPTLRLTLGARSAEFVATPLLDRLRKESLCKASLL